MELWSEHPKQYLLPPSQAVDKYEVLEISRTYMIGNLSCWTVSQPYRLAKLLDGPLKVLKPPKQRLLAALKGRDIGRLEKFNRKHLRMCMESEKKLCGVF